MIARARCMMARAWKYLKKKFKLFSQVWFSIFVISIIGRFTRVISLREEVISKLKHQQQNYIIACWHQNVFFCTWLLRHRAINNLISQSHDGELITRVMLKYGFSASRGSSSEGGAMALRQMVKHLKGTDPAAITPDGPRGPKFKVKPGAVALAKLSGLPLIPYHYEACQQFVFDKSWDGHKIPKPFTWIVTSWGDPIHIPKNLAVEDMPAFCDKVSEALMNNRQTVLEEVTRLQEYLPNAFWPRLWYYLRHKNIAIKPHSIPT